VGPRTIPSSGYASAKALGVDRSDAKSTTPNAATADLIATMRNLARSEKLHEGLAALYAYESQIPAVSKTKIDGLAAWYGITEPARHLIFSVHMEADVFHSQTARELL